MQTKHIAYIGVGSNLGDGIKNIHNAINLFHMNLIKILQISSIYESKPLDDVLQPNYTNAVCKTQTCLNEVELLEALQQIETKLGRIRDPNFKFASRIIDLDILLFDELLISNERLTIPHYDMHRRAFVLLPLSEIEPNIVIGNQHIKDLIKLLPNESILDLNKIHDRQITSVNLN